MRTRAQIAAPARLLAVFIVLSAIPLAALGWIGWSWLDSESEREANRVQQRLDNAGTSLVQELNSCTSSKTEALRGSEGITLGLLPLH